MLFEVFEKFVTSACFIQVARENMLLLINNILENISGMPRQNANATRELHRALKISQGNNKLTFVG